MFTTGNKIITIYLTLVLRVNDLPPGFRSKGVDVLPVFLFRTEYFNDNPSLLNFPYFEDRKRTRNTHGSHTVKENNKEVHEFLEK